ncbi:hypothetical protein MPTK2_1g01950 [Marchantia polymorpha subsp. ruderalis]
MKSLSGSPIFLHLQFILWHNIDEEVKDIPSGDSTSYVISLRTSGGGKQNRTAKQAAEAERVRGGPNGSVVVEFWTLALEGRQGKGESRQLGESTRAPHPNPSDCGSLLVVVPRDREEDEDEEDVKELDERREERSEARRGHGNLEAGGVGRTRPGAGLIRARAERGRDGTGSKGKERKGKLQERRSGTNEQARPRADSLRVSVRSCSFELEGKGREGEGEGRGKEEGGGASGWGRIGAAANGARAREISSSSSRRWRGRREEFGASESGAERMTQKRELSGCSLGLEHDGRAAVDGSSSGGRHGPLEATKAGIEG